MLQIGRKLYFDLSGSLILDCGERMGDVRETTTEEDFAVFPQLQGLAEADVQIVQMQYGERTAEWMNMGSVHLENGQVVIYPRLTISVDKAQIASDGVDTATITAIVPLNVSDVYTINFSVDGGENYPIVTNNKADFQFSATAPGIYTITAQSDLFGQNSLTVEVV